MYHDRVESEMKVQFHCYDIIDEEVEALGEAAKLMTIMEICKEDEQYEKCAIIKNRMEEVNRILRKGKKR